MTFRLLLAIWAGLSVLWSLAPDVTLFFLGDLAQLLVFVLLLWEFVVSYQDQLWVLRSLLLGMLVPLGMQLVSFGGIARGYAVTEAEATRYSGGGLDLNYLAHLFSVSVVIATYLATNPSENGTLVPLGLWRYVPAAVLGALLTGSRGGYLCLLLAAFFVLLLCGFSLRRVLSWFKYLVPTALVSALLWYVVLPVALQSRLSEGTLTADTFSVRVGFWQRGLEYSFLRQPRQGIGLGAVRARNHRASASKTAVAHNVAISVLVELGVVGMLLFLVLLVSLYWAACACLGGKSAFRWGFSAFGCSAPWDPVRRLTNSVGSCRHWWPRWLPPA